MRKFATVFIALFLILSLTACKDTQKEEQVKNELIKMEQKTEEVKEKSKKIEIQEVQELGNGTIYLTGPSGTTENKETLKIFAEKGTLIQQIGLEAREVDGSHLSYIYLDNELLDKKQLADTQTSLELTDEKGLQEGMHQIIVKQYDNDEETGNVILLKEMKYEIMNK